MVASSSLVALGAFALSFSSTQGKGEWKRCETYDAESPAKGRCEVVKALWDTIGASNPDELDDQAWYYTDFDCEEAEFGGDPCDPDWKSECKRKPSAQDPFQELALIDITCSDGNSDASVIDGFYIYPMYEMFLDIGDFGFPKTVEEFQNGIKDFISSPYTAADPQIFLEGLGATAFNMDYACLPECESRCIFHSEIIDVTNSTLADLHTVTIQNSDANSAGYAAKWPVGRTDLAFGKGYDVCSALASPTRQPTSKPTLKPTTGSPTATVTGSPSASPSTAPTPSTKTTTPAPSVNTQSTGPPNSGASLAPCVVAALCAVVLLVL